VNIFQWLKEQGYEYTWNFKIGTKTPDIIAFKEKEIAMFEIKKHATEVSKAVGQCLFYLQNANKAYVILPRKEIKKVRLESFELLKKYGIGLVQANKDIKIIIEPKFFQNSNEEVIKKLKSKSLSRIHFSRNDMLSQRGFKREIKDKIFKTLSKHPEGLTFTQIAVEMRMHRHTVTKYVYELKGEGIVFVRDLKTLKLCYLKKHFKGSKVAK
jgi:Holliday junction resolvase